MNFKGFTILTLLINSFLFFSCGNEAVKTADSNQTDSVKQNPKSVGTIKNEATMFALPAPMQVVSILKEANIPFSEKILIPLKQPGAITSEYHKALYLGMYSVEIGYLISYEQRQSALNYYKTIDNLLSSLYISPNLMPNTIKRFEKNVNNKDSLSAIILQSYNNWQTYFQSNKRENVGLYIISGSYIEGLYLSLLQADKNQSPSLKNMIGQQKVFLDNILELSNYMDKKPDFDDLYLKLGSIQDAYASINVNVNDIGKGESIVACTYTPEQIKRLLAKVTEVRNSIIK